MLLATDTTTELAEFLTHQVHCAKRVNAVVGTTDRPTEWDHLHATINAGLDDWQACAARDGLTQPPPR